MTTPIADFLQAYRSSKTIRLHMPGHKGCMGLGCESLDITEIHGADSLYEAAGIIAESEHNAGELFGSGGTFYSTEGSSQCIRAMLYLAVLNRPKGSLPVILAARNVHCSFLYAAAALDIQVRWLWPDSSTSLCRCVIDPEKLALSLREMTQPPTAVYLTCPDYLGTLSDLRTIADICHQAGTLLLVDNAHGAYLRFLQPSLHPLDSGADLCCDSAHKTLPVLTAGAYLHISRRLGDNFVNQAKRALALFGSTSPSYLTLASLDLCNAYLSGSYSARLNDFICKLNQLKQSLSRHGWQVEPSDPLRLTLAAPVGKSGQDLARLLRHHGVECEFCDRDYLVCMLTPNNSQHDLDLLQAVLESLPVRRAMPPTLPIPHSEAVVSIREALLSPYDTVSTQNAQGRICAAPTVSCPPAIPIVVSGERIGPAALKLFEYYGIETVDVLRDN